MEVELFVDEGLMAFRCCGGYREAVVIVDCGWGCLVVE